MVYVRGFASLTALILLASCASKVNPLGEASCSVLVPPPDAGELAVHGKLMRVHPRISNMPADFNGCQTVWADDQGGWVISRVLVQRGRVAKLVGSKLECTYVGGKLQSVSSGDCPVYEPELVPSEPAGCISQSSVGQEPNAACVVDAPLP
jgi:hypothetical protein